MSRRSLAVLLSVMLLAPLLAVPASASAVVRRAPTSLRLTADPAAGIAWGKTTTLKATLLDEAGKPLPNERLMVLRSVLGSAWTTVTSVYSTTGSYQVSVAPGQAVTRFRAAFRGDAEHRPAMADVVVLPQAYLTISSPATVYKPPAQLTVSGNLRPRHVQGKSWVTLQCDQLVGGRWTRQRNFSTSTSDYNSFSQYSATITLPYTGKWRIRAYHSDAEHAPSYSPWTYTTVLPDTAIRISGTGNVKTGWYRLAKGTHTVTCTASSPTGFNVFQALVMLPVPPPPTPPPRGPVFYAGTSSWTVAADTSFWLNVAASSGTAWTVEIR